MNSIWNRVGIMRVLGTVVVALFMLGCGSSKGSSTVAQYYGDYHPAGWISAHGGQALAGVDACTKCHELSIIKVGSGVPTCLTTGCHHQSTPGWSGAAIHGMRAKLAIQADGGSLVSCQLCHGKDFSGGPSASACASCHGVQAPHPAKPWRVSGGSVNTHSTTDPSNAAVCAQCHYPGSANNPAGQPFTPAAAGTQPGCYNATLCHGANPAPHPIPFLAGQTDNKLNGHLSITATAFAADCATCHAYSGASPVAAAPLCNVCHRAGDPVAVSTQAGTCLSCHAGPAGLPGGPSGSTFPSLAGAHAKHMALGTPLTCNTCHAGTGAGTTAHYTNANYRVGTPAGPAPVVIDAVFTPKSGGQPGFTGASATCSNVSCHGAQTTPSWMNGTLNSATQCTACHGVATSASTATQANDAYGRHSVGTHNATVAANGTACTTCHSMNNGSPGAVAHFKYLATSAIEGLASGTIVFDGTIVTGAKTYTPSATVGDGSCALTCHTHVHASAVDGWTSAGTPHPIPFLGGQADTQGNGHLTATATTFAADCAQCHAQTGVSPTATAPACAVCHTAANPTVAGTGVGTCLSCHSGASGLPTGPTGTAFPSIAGAHIKHMGLATPLTCDTCHAGSGAGTATHYSAANARVTAPVGPAAVNLDPTYNALSGKASFNPTDLTCSAASCHGGKQTPNWRTGTINSTSQCMTCHAIYGGTGQAQYNDAIGRHAWGTHSVAGTLDCTICHAMANGSLGAVNHFAELNTTNVSSPSKLPSGTIKFSLTNATYPVTGAATYTISATFPEGDGGCALTCHSMSHVNTVNHWNAPQSAGAAHPVPFLSGQVSTSLGYGHLTVTATQFAADCAVCHAYSGTSPDAAAPLCNVCHQAGNPVAAGTNAGTCLSCHAGTAGLPTGPGGSAFPSLAGAHVKHMALATQLTCDSCHAGSGTGTTTHYTNANARTGTPVGPATVAIDQIFTPKTGGAPGFTGSSSTCSNVSCHGAQVTPGWLSGTLNSATQCTACHAVAATAGTITQFNDAFGRHSLGTHNATTAANSIACTTCHNMTNGSQGALAHFKYLNTSAVDGVATGLPADQLPSGTIVFDPLIATGAGTYTVTSATQGNGGCALICHTHTHTAVFNTWTATGAPHPVPFLAGQTDSQSNGHLTVTPAAFSSDCATCHAYSGTSPIAGAPLCATCHTLANPTSAGTGIGTCLSCHAGPSGLPAGPTGSAFPNIAGAHAKHMGLLTPLSCDSCHAGAGTGTTTHYNNANAIVTPPAGPATVAIDATFNAQSGGSPGFSLSALTCSSVSCHGGQVTPNWQSGTITSTSQCLLCHAVNSGATASQYNDAIGRHAWGTHSNASALDCTICHDMSTANTNGGAVNHFKYLNTTAVSGVGTGTPADQFPSGTIKFKVTNTTYPITGAATYTINATTPEGDGGCALSCHSQTHDPTVNHWGAPKGSGVAHPVPFLSTDVSNAGNHHQTVTLAQFNAECTTCHDPSGTSTKTGPVCTVCHTLGSPVAAGMTAGTCLSCHVGSSFTTQGPTGSTWPNIQGAHPKHLSLGTFTRTTPALPASLMASAYPDCAACHVGALPGDATNTHYSNANLRHTPLPTAPGTVAIDPTFNAQSGTAGTVVSASAFTCSNISCHGGQTTPGWQTGTNPVNATTYCIACHVVGASQYNAPTGRHTASEHKQTCDYCHSMTVALPGAQNHFKYLDTSVVSGVSGTPSDQYPSDTIVFGSVPTGAKTYTVTGTGLAQGKGGCALSCHGQTHTTSGNHWN